MEKGFLKNLRSKLVLEPMVRRIDDEIEKRNKDFDAEWAAAGGGSGAAQASTEGKSIPIPHEQMEADDFTQEDVERDTQEHYRAAMVEAGERAHSRMTDPLISERARSIQQEQKAAEMDEDELGLDL